VNSIVVQGRAMFEDVHGSTKATKPKLDRVHMRPRGLLTRESGGEGPPPQV
jgi:hypothetical protein